MGYLPFVIITRAAGLDFNSNGGRWAQIDGGRGLSDREAQADKNVSRLEEGVEPGVWRYVKADRARVIIDAADYFAVMQAAMLKARSRLLMIGWDFDTRIHLAAGRSWWQKAFRRKYPSRLGSFIVWLTNHHDELEIRILKWSFGVFKFAVRAPMWFDIIRWFPHRRIDFKFDSAHPVGCSHHQKIAVIDDSLAVCGGIDMTTRRWDTRDHLENEPYRRTPGGSKYGPWHDATMMAEGEIAQALSELGRDRWIRAGGKPLEALERRPDSIWPDGLTPHFENVELGIARTRAAYRDWEAVSEIRELFVRHIARAKRHIYAESQYFASRVVAEAILERLREDDPPEIVIVHPAHADGWLEQQAMDHARAELVTAIRAADHAKRFSLWVPYTGETPIYVHAKIMIVDDEVIRIGSANLNNRSLGLDSECDVFIDAARPGNEHCRDGIAGLRASLLGEHCGLTESEMAALIRERPSMRAIIEELGRGASLRKLREYEVPELDAVQEKLAESAVLDPERPDDMFEPYAKGGLFREGSRLARLRKRVRRRMA